MKFTAPSASEKQNWAHNLWVALEEIAHNKVFEVDILVLMSQQQVFFFFFFFFFFKEDLCKNYTNTTQQTKAKAGLVEGAGADAELETPKVMMDCLQYLYTKGITKKTVSALEKKTLDVFIFFFFFIFFLSSFPLILLLTRSLPGQRKGPILERKIQQRQIY